MKRCLILIAAAASSPLVAGDASEPLAFNRDIRPILADKCFACHGPDASHRKADLRLDVEAAATADVIVPGHAEQSELIARIHATDDEVRMPPPDATKQLTDAERAALRAWIDQGAKWQQHWAFEPVSRPALPQNEATWIRGPLDRFVLRKIEKAGLRPSAAADRATLIRRLSLDLIGLPPTIEEVDAFLSDTSADAYERVVDRLLDSEHYGERMAMDWLDAARFADSNGFQNDFGRSMWPWRDWVINAFNTNLPFDQFTLEQIAGDLLPAATQSQRIATGFNRNNRTVTEGGSIDEEWRIENAVDRVETTSTVFLGLTVGCARCHAHKYDPIAQEDFYAFLAFFNTHDEKGAYIETRGNVPPLIELPSPADAARLSELDQAIAAAKRRIDTRPPEAAAKSPPAPTTSENEARAELERLEKERSDLQKQIPSVMVMREMAEPRKTYVLRRGRYDAPDTSKEIVASVPAFLPPLPAGAPRNRLGLARWLIDPHNPLVARVAVNRLWQKFFGEGLVRTSENFGTQGTPPTHPELLDWLASEFVAGGWDLKAIQKQIVMSATYRQSSLRDEHLQRIDPDNRQLARGPRHRLSAEILRDNALAISGLLDRTIGGPSTKPYQPEGLWTELAGGASQGPYVQDQGTAVHRRSLYTNRKRTVPHPTLSTFDAPSFEICWVKRARTNTPLQALALLNDTTYVEAARQLASRMMGEAGASPAARIEFAFRVATARHPRPSERAILEAGYRRYVEHFASDPAAAVELTGHGESPVDDAANRVEQAACASIAGILLNLDETINKE